MSERRRLPLVEGPVALVSPRVARLLLDTWDRAVTPALRSSGEAVPDDLADFIDACRVVATRRTSAVGSAVDEGAEADAGSVRGETTAQAAARLGVSGSRVRQRLRAGGLPGEKVGGTWWVDPAAVEDHRAVRAQSG